MQSSVRQERPSAIGKDARFCFRSEFLGARATSWSMCSESNFTVYTKALPDKPKIGATRFSIVLVVALLGIGCGWYVLVRDPRSISERERVLSACMAAADRKKLREIEEIKQRSWAEADFKKGDQAVAKIEKRSSQDDIQVACALLQHASSLHLTAEEQLYLWGGR